MKKITFFILVLFTTNGFSQTWSTGPVEVTTGYTIQFDVNTGTNMVTLTMIGPDNQWLGVGPGISAGGGMGNEFDDAIVYNSSGLQDRNMLSGTGQPNLDTSTGGTDDWSVLSNDTAGGVRTLVATRSRDTGDSNDFVFPTTGGALPFLWAKGSSLSFGYHGGTKGGVVANLTLGVSAFVFNEFKISPNPVSTDFEIELPDTVENANVGIYDVLGKQLYSGEISKLNSNINVSDFSNGIYLVKVSNGSSSQTKRIIKQ